jgi:UDP:flavonoid glycosyltransferase YjiC (YdhE family)
MSITEERTRFSKLASKCPLQIHIEKKPNTVLTTFYRGGTPQVILPQWFDTYDCPSRVEWLGIGVHGSRDVAPKIAAPELASAVLRVLKDKGIQSRARDISDICKTTEGRVFAHDQIVEYAQKDL